MNELTGLFGIVSLLAIFGLVLAAILMPIFVMIIDSKMTKIQKSLAAMEHMMRHGK